MSAHTEGKLELWTSNSWRRFGVRGGGPVCEPITQNDGHPDLYFRNGGPDGPDARRLVACWNACEGVSTELIEKAAPEAEVAALRKDRQSLNGMTTLLANARRDRNELLESLDQMTAWARHVKADGGRALVLADHIKTADALLAKHAPKVPG